MVRRRILNKDLNTKSSPFYIREKIELGIIADRIAKPWVKYLIMTMIILYMYGAILLKYVGGAESFVVGISYTIWKNEHEFEDKLGFDPYYFGVFVFGFFSIYFSFGNIENAKVL